MTSARAAEQSSWSATATRSQPCAPFDPPSPSRQRWWAAMSARQARGLSPGAHHWPCPRGPRSFRNLHPWRGRGARVGGCAPHRGRLGGDPSRPLRRRGPDSVPLGTPGEPRRPAARRRPPPGRLRQEEARPENFGSSWFGRQDRSKSRRSRPRSSPDCSPLPSGRCPHVRRTLHRI